MAQLPESESSSPKYWLSLEQWRQDPMFRELAEKEFLSSPLQEVEDKDGWARREFLKLMGASLALTSFGCTRQPQWIVPYAKKPKEVLHGISNYYASTLSDGSEGFGILVTTRDGRPIKIEGNPDHPLNRGGMSARAHSFILSLYDPERLSGPRRNLHNEKKTNRETVTVSYEDLDKAIAEQLKKGGVAVLTGSLTSPSTERLLADFAGAFKAKAYTWDGLSYDDLAEGQKLSYGQAVVPRYRLDRARVVLAVENDFLGTYLNPTPMIKDFAAGRKPTQEMTKLIAFESLMSLTGTNADERFQIRPAQSLDVIMGILHVLISGKKLSRFASDNSVLAALKPFANAETDLGLPPGTLARVADALWAQRGKSLVLAGGWSQGEHTVALQIAANFLNSVLENDGQTVLGNRSLWGGFTGRNSSLKELQTDLNAGRIKTLIIHGCNPGYAASQELAEAFKRAEMVIYTGDRLDETAKFADYVVPDHHPLENWGDSEFISGVYAIQQPTVQPLHQTRAFQDSLLSWLKVAGQGPARAKSAESWYTYLREAWRELHGRHRGVAQASKSFEDFWIATLHAGVFNTAGEAGSGSPRTFNTAALRGIQKLNRNEGYELCLYTTVGLRDGSLANVSWLQEFPDPVTKTCWDNFLSVAPKDAQREGWQEGDMVRVKLSEKFVDLPVHVQPGQAPGVLGLAIGYGRRGAGKVADGVGYNAFSLAEWRGARLLTSGLPVMSVTKQPGNYPIANTQGHHSMEGRQIVVEAALGEFLKNPEANIHRHKIVTMWSEHKYPNNKWGMVIDLNTCTGCGACVIACQSENNIPVVGKKQVLLGREMHWIRVDRYYVGDPETPDVVHQPVLCMHCDNAPCETVCPVMATVHSDEGTNDMIYNRCVGTRYCSNNCPYKVRRFNWHNYNKIEKPLNYAMNPDVTVRARGVMEKCTFCIHRIRSVKSKVKLEGRTLKDGDVQTACQQSCPTQAIVFGDLNDSESKLRQVYDDKNSYILLEELNAKPAVRYRSKIRNAAAVKGGHGGHGGHHS